MLSSQKANEQPGWMHRLARQRWLDTLEGELALRKKRHGWNQLAHVETDPVKK